MSDLNLYLRISSLPTAIKTEIIDYLEFISSRKIKEKTHLDFYHRDPFDRIILAQAQLKIKKL